MSQYKTQRQKILIADDCKFNRDLLSNILEDRYELVEVSSGVEVVAMLQHRAVEFSLLLLDIHMPEMDGFEVLAYMNRYHWIEEVPVVVISADDSADCIERAYGLGVTDFIHSPFDATLVRCRIQNTLLLSARQRGLVSIVAGQIREKKRGDELMVSILSHIVEFRNGESGLHVQHIGMITELLLHRLVRKTERYVLTNNDISTIVMASALHDIGKMAIPDEIVNKPGRLTPEEREIMRGHALAGAEMLDALSPQQRKEPLVETAYEICRWHHERYDGGGYPDGLKGEEIPISAQVVSVADVYDALTSKRCYKDACTHQEALDMILTGLCGAFNPLLLECLEELGDTIQRKLENNVARDYDDVKIQRVADQLQSLGLSAPEQMVQQLDCERQQLQFLYENSKEPMFWYTVSPSLLHVNEACQHLLGLESTILDPKEDKSLLHSVGEALRTVLESMYRTTPERPEASADVQLEVRGRRRWFRCNCRTIWAPYDFSHYTSMVGLLEDLDRDCAPAAATQVRSAAELIRGKVCSMSGVEAQTLMDYFSLIFQTVRLVDADACRRVEIGPNGCILDLSDHCYDLWGRDGRCDNCTCAKCVASKKQASKLEYKGDDIYRVMSFYVEVDGTPYALELVDHVRDVDDIIEGYSKRAVLKAIESHNKTLYTDPVTRVYNRRYYEDQLDHLSKAYAVAMMDVDNFKDINDTWGHQAGDVALFQIAQAIRSCVRATDAVVRYGGDEFVVVFRDIPEDTFRRKLEEIQEKVRAIRVEAYPEMRCAVSIGGCHGDGNVSQLLARADKEMYVNKRNRKSRKTKE